MLAVLLAGCASSGGDTDGGGCTRGEDCDDHDATVHPGVEEVCNELDDDCDGEVDEGFAVRDWFADSDGDGWGDETVATTACAAPEGYVATSGDCDDRYAGLHPGAREVACDGLDQDCDGQDGPCLGLGSLPTWRGTVAEDCIARSLAGPGDVDGDGYDDLLISSTACNDCTPGKAFFARGGPIPVDATLEEVAVVYAGVDPYRFAGWTVAGAGDLDVDGHADMAVSAPWADTGEDYAGAVYVIFGGSDLAGGSLDQAGAVVCGITRASFIGVGLAGGGDVDGDGLDDLLIGAPYTGSSSTGDGAVYLLLGSAALATTSLADAAAVLVAGTGGRLGSAVARAGDVDADGTPDILCGAPYDSASDRYAGTVYLLSGADLW